MLSRYNLKESDDGLSYVFTSEGGDIYTAYFTYFFLQGEDGTEITVRSFGFEQLKVNSSNSNKFDGRIKATIQFIVAEFFRKNPEDALLYVCMLADGFARNRHVTFSKWFHEFNENLVKFDSLARYSLDSFYSSLIMLASNPQKELIKNAFYFTISSGMD